MRRSSPYAFSTAAFTTRDHGRRHVNANAITLDKRNDRIVRDVQRRIGVDRDLLAPGGDLDVFVLHAVFARKFLILKVSRLDAASVSSVCQRGRHGGRRAFYR